MALVNRIYLLIIFFLVTPVILLASEPKGIIELTITNIRNDKGLILLSLFNQPDGFPSDSTKVLRAYVLEVKAPKLRMTIEELPPGVYAIALVHDENQNLQLDTNLVGAPVEGYAASGSNRRFASPRFESSKFSVGHRSVFLEIKMNYLF